MPGSAQCRQCGTELSPEDHTGQTCAVCLIQVGLDASLDSGEDLPADVPQRVGPYEMLRCLGEGGMGIVYLAEQKEPLARRVALKLIKLGMDTSQVIARFESERQALALMNHPNIAQVHEAGVTPEGRPYFVMEYVPGIPITSFCDEQKLDLRQRLELFTRACDAIQHAHQRGIIHRDIKPSNVLVAEEDGIPTVKVIDFGVAKAIKHELTARSMVTQMGVLIGTPEYMSPEQAELGGHEIDTRTDVYSLGVLLYELLVGTLPFDLGGDKRAGLDEVRRRIREEDPAKPSTRVTTLGEAATLAVEHRRTDVRALARALRGDLDWITMKAVEKEPGRRYGTPSELSADIRRHLHHEPVLAGPPSVAYRAGKFVQRHTLGVGAAALLILLLVAFSVTMAIQASRIARERDRANLEASAASRVSRFLTDLFKVSDPSEARGNTVTAREILDRGKAEIETLADQPELQARMMGSMGIVYRNLGLHSQAAPLLEESLQTLRRLKSIEHPDTLRSMRELGALLVAQGELDRAEALLTEALEGSRRVLGEDHLDTVASVGAMGAICYYQSRLEDAESYYRDALASQRRLLGDEHPDTLETVNNMSALLYSQGNPAEAERWAREGLQGRRRALGEDHPHTLDSVINVAVLLQIQGKLEEAEPFGREAVEASRRVYGPDHPNTLVATNNLAHLLLKQGKLDDAEAYYREALDSLRRVLGEDHPDTLTTMGNLGDMYTSQGRLEEAEALLATAIELVREALPGDHVATGYTLRKYGRCLTSAGRYSQAEEALLEAHRVLRATVGDDHVYTKQTVENLAELYEAWDRPEEAGAWRTEPPVKTSG